MIFTATIKRFQKILNWYFEATLNINVKSLTGYTPKTEKDEEGNEKTLDPKDVTVTVKANSSVVYDKEILENTENLTVKFENSGNLTIEVLIEGVLKKKTYLDLNKETTLDIQ